MVVRLRWLLDSAQRGAKFCRKERGDASSVHGCGTFDSDLASISALDATYSCSYVLGGGGARDPVRTCSCSTALIYSCNKYRVKKTVDCIQPVTIMIAAMLCGVVVQRIQDTCVNYTPGNGMQENGMGMLQLPPTSLVHVVENCSVSCVSYQFQPIAHVPSAYPACESCVHSQ
jgi:hypothetical protein